MFKALFMTALLATSFGTAQALEPPEEDQDQEAPLRVKVIRIDAGQEVADLTFQVGTEAFDILHIIYSEDPTRVPPDPKLLKDYYDHDPDAFMSDVDRQELRQAEALKQ